MKERTERYREKYFVERKCVKEITLRGAGFKTDKSMKVKKEGYFKTGIEIIKNLTAGTAVRREIKKELIERAKISKLVSSVLGSEPGKGYVNKVQDDNKMHPRYNQSRTGTGRYSSKDPNGQNFPRSKEDQEGFLNPIKTMAVE
jgi:DNA polymerase I-like protein with 3'-5' exonuclease and polymerase domains